MKALFLKSAKRQKRTLEGDVQVAYKQGILSPFLFPRSTSLMYSRLLLFRVLLSRNFSFLP